MATIIDDIKSWIDEIMKNENVETYELNILGNASKGDGYSGDIIFVNVKTSGSEKDYDFVVKSAIKSDKLREQAPVKEIYLREIYFFSTIFPVFEQFQLEYSIEEPFKKYPKCYKVCEEEKKETLVLENLKAQGFELHNRKVTMNLDHIQFVFVQYARLHAAAMAMRQLKPDLFRAITKEIISNVFGEFVIQTNTLSHFIELMTNALKLLNSGDAKKFAGYEAEIDELLIKATYDPEDPITVVLHADCWNNNMMFKYDQANKTKPTDVRFLDYQISQIAHPIIDLSYFLYACCGKEILDNFDSLLELYHSTLSDSLLEYGIDVNTFFPLSKLREDWKTIGKYGLYMCLFTIQFALCESSEAIDFAEVAENDQDYGNSIKAVKKNDEDYNERVKVIMEHFSEMFL